jgi:(2Fe-2S) ferredoxin
MLARGLVGKVQLRVTGCHGYCELEPSVLVVPSGTFYPRVDMAAMARIVEAVARDEVLEDLLYVDESTGRRIRRQADIPFFRGQTAHPAVAQRAGGPHPSCHYIREGGYAALATVLERRDPAWVIER